MKKDYNFFVYFDANLGHIKGINRKEYEQLLKYTNHFYQVTGGIKADDFLLQYADAKKQPVISNDQFRDFEKKYPWLSFKELKTDEKLIKGGVAGSVLQLPSLGICAEIVKSKNYFQEFNKLFTKKQLLDKSKDKINHKKTVKVETARKKNKINNHLNKRNLKSLQVTLVKSHIVDLVIKSIL